MRGFQVAASTAAVALIIVFGVGILAGSFARAKTGRIPILMDTQASAASSRVSFEEGFAPVVKSAIPAVVNVSSTKVIRAPGKNSPFSDPFFRQFFGDQIPPNFPGSSSTEREQSLGSGVIVSPDGYILTNNHVLNGAKDITVLLGDKREFKARVVGADSRTDIAVLKIDAHNLPVLTFGDSSKLQVGSFVLAIGNPFRLNQTVTMGIVSATGRGGLGIEDYEDFIQTDAAINPGNSGGALIDVRGDLIGINTAIIAERGGGNEGVGFAIPGNMARTVMDQILKTGKVTRAWLGVSIQSVNQDIAKAFHLGETYGALVNGVTPDGPAAKAWIQIGDIIVDVNGEGVEDDRALQFKIGAMSPGATVKLTVFRKGATQDLTVKLGEMPPASPTKAEPAALPSRTEGLRGISAGELTRDAIRQIKLPSETKGVLATSIDPASAAKEAGIQKGDVIEEVNRQPVNSIALFKQAIRSADNKPVLLFFNRSGETAYAVVQPR